MKKKLLIFIVMACMIFPASAKLYTIYVNENSFSPSFFSAYAGDTIMWKWTRGIHTTTSISVPPGAIPWSSNINSADTLFTYVPVIAGTYNYECTLKAIAGQFIVVNQPTINHPNQKPIISVFPNPASDVLHVKFNLKKLSSKGLPLQIIMVDYNGKTWINNKFTDFRDADIDLHDVPSGNYNLHAEQGKRTFNQLIVIAH